MYSGFLLGGEAIYKADTDEEEKNQDMDLVFPWYHLTNGTKIYMKGMLEDSEIDVQEYPPLIWRRIYNSIGVCCHWRLYDRCNWTWHADCDAL